MHLNHLYVHVIVVRTIMKRIIWVNNNYPLVHKLCIHPSIFLSIYLSIHLPTIYPFIHQSIHPLIHLFIYPSIHPLIHLFIYPSIHPLIHLFIYPSIHPSISLASTHLSNTTSRGNNYRTFDTKKEELETKGCYYSNSCIMIMHLLFIFI